MHNLGHRGFAYSWRNYCNLSRESICPCHLSYTVGPPASCARFSTDLQSVIIHTFIKPYPNSYKHSYAKAKTAPRGNYAYCCYEVRFLNVLYGQYFSRETKKHSALGIYFSLEQNINPNRCSFYSSRI